MPVEIKRDNPDEGLGGGTRAVRGPNNPDKLPKSTPGPLPAKLSELPTSTSQHKQSVNDKGDSL